MHLNLLLAVSTLCFLSLAQARPGSFRSKVGQSLSSDTWCGFVKQAAVTTVSATWIVPNVSIPNPGSQGDYEVFQWVGIDGAGPSDCSQNLLQGGISQVFYKGTYTTDFWYEFYNPSQTPSLHVNDPPVQIGDTVRVTVTATSAYQGSILMENLSQQASQTYTVSSQDPLCFQHVEWITEAPAPKFPSFETFDFTDAYAVTSDGTTINASGSDEWYMNNSKARCSASMSNGGSTVAFYNK